MLDANYAPCYTLPVTMNAHRYITRYNGQKGSRNAFCGWRVCITRQKETFVRYFTDREWGSREKALEAALEMRNAMLDAMSRGCDFVALSNEYKKRKSRGEFA